VSTSSTGAGLVVRGLRGGPNGTEILQGLDIEVPPGEVHALMGPNGSGKSTLSHLLMGRPGYDVTGGSAHLNGVDLLALPTSQRAAAGLFLGMQYPTEVPGVDPADLLVAALAGAGLPADRAAVVAEMGREAERIGFEPHLLARALNVDLSGGEKKRNETVQLTVLRPKVAILDEIDSGLDVDALRAVSRRVMEAVAQDGLGVLAITHYNRLLAELRATKVHVFVKGRVVATGGPELAEDLERSGYDGYLPADAESDGSPNGLSGASQDPFAFP
jgi:Fe-S cluster assembly ATP-binding protein